MSQNIAQIIRTSGSWSGSAGTISLDYEGRFFRRKLLTSTDGEKILVDLPQTTSLNQGDAVELTDGRLMEITAAPEPVLIVTGENLARIGWHIGNRHTPCQIEADRLIILDDPVIAHMLDHVGARCVKATLPFTPEGGAYGHGRTHSHDHGNSAHTHDHSHAH
ncbi:urease accessory protein UreE [Cognatishimia sp.]|uniref:urease accessory protein UreE n=1 Tax=Cognatishimia sp. TaxID=2211648 RepID=UPI0035176E5C